MQPDTMPMIVNGRRLTHRRLLDTLSSQRPVSSSPHQHGRLFLGTADGLRARRVVEPSGGALVPRGRREAVPFSTFGLDDDIAGRGLLSGRVGGRNHPTGVEAMDRLECRKQTRLGWLRTCTLQSLDEELR